MPEIPEFPSGWYSNWMQLLAKNYSKTELEKMRAMTHRDAEKNSAKHLRTIEKTASMSGMSMSRAHARNSTAVSGDRLIAIDGALEIHRLYPDHAKPISTSEQHKEAP